MGLVPEVHKDGSQEFLGFLGIPGNPDLGVQKDGSREFLGFLGIPGNPDLEVQKDGTSARGAQRCSEGVQDEGPFNQGNKRDQGYQNTHNTPGDPSYLGVGGFLGIATWRCAKIASLCTSGTSPIFLRL